MWVGAQIDDLVKSGMYEDAVKLFFKALNILKKHKKSYTYNIKLLEYAIGLKVPINQAILDFEQATNSPFFSVYSIYNMWYDGTFRYVDQPYTLGDIFLPLFSDIQIALHRYYLKRKDLN